MEVIRMSEVRRIFGAASVAVFFFALLIVTLVTVLYVVFGG
jgi:hypothetical protein